jgi:hypothetical protein
MAVSTPSLAILCEFEPERSGTDHRDRTRKRRQLEDCLVRQNDVAELLQGLRHAWAGSRGDHDRLGEDLAPVVERERSLARKTSPLPDADTRGYLLDRLQRFGDEPVALLAHASHDGATVHGSCRFDTERRSLARVVRCIRRGDE